MRDPYDALGVSRSASQEEIKQAYRRLVKASHPDLNPGDPVLEQTGSEQDREFAATALTQCAVLAARWRQVLGAWPLTQAFPGGSE